mgnify:CR=1 FL=1
MVYTKLPTAHIDSQTKIRITWDTNMVSKYDNMTDAELFEFNLNRGGKRGVWERMLNSKK